MKRNISFLVLTIIISFTSIYFYDKFIKTTTNKIIQPVLSKNNYPVKYNTNSSIFNQDRPDFIATAEKTINTVVHVKNSLNSSDKINLEDLIFGRDDNKNYKSELDRALLYLQMVI